MALTPGSRLGPYEILSALGAGGMGEVYRGRDPRLGWDVAIKVLPDRLARDSEALSRFEREAKAVAAASVFPNASRGFAGPANFLILGFLRVFLGPHSDTFSHP
jgi:serine/threonine protein kinase